MRGNILGIKNSAGLVVPYYSELVDEVRMDRNIFFQAIVAVPSLAEYFLTNPLMGYKGVKRLFKEVAKRTIF